MNPRNHSPSTALAADGDKLALAQALQGLGQAIHAVLLSGAAEDVHQLRVQALRLDVWLRLAGRRMLRDDLAWLRRCAAALRDLDVALALAKDTAVRAALQCQRESLLRLLRKNLKQQRVLALTQALALLPPLDRERANALAKQWLARLLEYGRWLDFERDEVRELHRLRRRIRRLRYAWEWLGNPVPELHELQAELGLIHDALVARGGDSDSAVQAPQASQPERRRIRDLWSQLERALRP